MDTYKNGSFITYGCNVGFTLVKGVQQCVEQEWQGEDPHCERSMFNLQASWVHKFVKCKLLAKMEIFQFHKCV